MKRLTASWLRASARWLPFSRGTIAAVTSVIAAIAWLYADTLSSLVRQWASDDNFSHGFFVVPFAAYFMWERRRAFRAAALRPSAAGLVLLAISLLLFVAGRLGAELFLSRVSLIGVIAGAIWFMAGREHLRIAAFPLAFLLLMIPLPAVIFNQITFPLQTIAARAGQAIIAAGGVPVLRDGHVLQVPGRTLEVAEACSGIRSLMSLFMMAIVLGYFAAPGGPGGRGQVVRRVMLVIAAVPIAVIANAVRVAGTGLACYWISPDAAEGFFHTFSGWIMFTVALVFLLLIQGVMNAGHRLRRLPPKAPAQVVA